MSEKQRQSLGALIVKFIYDDKPSENSRNISKFPYLSTQIVHFIKERNFQVIALNTPSFDNESSKDLENHHAWFHES